MEITRRQMWQSMLLAGVASAALPLTGAQPALAASNAATPQPHMPMSPEDALRVLREGNDAFLRGDVKMPDTSAKRRLELAKGQSPFCAYVSCSDSRVPPELLFGRGLGELFIVRNAGNTLSTTALGSIEYAVAVLKVPLIVIMGHEACGAVKAAMDVVEKNARFPGAIDNMIEPIIPAVLEARGQKGDPFQNAVRQNVRRTVRMLREDTDELLLKPQRSGALKVVGAYYALDTGKVDFFDV